MTPTLKIQNSSKTADIYDSTLKLRNWNTATSQDGEPVWETYELVSRDTAANIRTAVHDVDILFDAARRYANNKLEDDPTWLYVASEGESTRRAVVTDGAIKQVTEAKNNPLLPQDGGFFSLALERGPYWEAATAGTILNWERFLSSGTHVAIMATGTTPVYGRINQTFVTDGAYGTAINESQYDNVWLGMRQIYKGGTGFIPVLPLDNAGAYNGGTSLISVENLWSSGRYLVDYIGGGSALSKRFDIQLYDVQSDTTVLDDYIGNYLVLLRARMYGTADVVRFQMRQVADTMITAADAFGDVYVDAAISGTSIYRLIPVGNITIPGVGNRDNLIGGSANPYLANTGFEIWSQAVSVASGTVDVDGFYLMPSEHLFTVNDCQFIAKATATIHQVELYNHPDNSFTCIYNSGVTGGGGFPIYNVNDWRLPGGSVLACCIAEKGTTTTSKGHVLTGTVDVFMTAFNRYENFIG